MGNSFQSIDKTTRKRPNIINEDDMKSGNIPFIKNVNRYGDSDYDDEVDVVEAVDAYDAQIAKEREQLHDSQAGDVHYDDVHQGTFDALLGGHDRENLKGKLLADQQPCRLAETKGALDDQRQTISSKKS